MKPVSMKNDPGCSPPTARNGGPLLSLFPGIGLMDRGFESEGFCVVRGPDTIWGGDVATFSPSPNCFDGVFGGPPCQDFSSARRALPTGDGLRMLDHFKRIVREADPIWWLLENVPRVPDVKIPGYSWLRIDIRASDFGVTQLRNRHFQFGTRDGTVPIIVRPLDPSPVTDRCVTASDTSTPLSHMAALQGLPFDFSVPGMNKGALRRAIGNGVPVPVAREFAKAIKFRLPADMFLFCACHCGRIVSGSQTYALGACRKRAFDRRLKQPTGAAP